MIELEPHSQKKASRRSGEHPAVKAYREKLKSVDQGGTAAVSKLDHELEEYLEDLKTMSERPSDVGAG